MVPVSERYNQWLSDRGAQENLSKPQFYHGSADHFETGDTIDPGKPYERVGPESMPGQAYFTTDKVRASFYADRASKKRGTPPRVYQVEPQGDYRQDRMTRRSPENKVTSSPLKVVGEEPRVDWQKTHHVV